MFDIKDDFQFLCVKIQFKFIEIDGLLKILVPTLNSVSIKHLNSSNTRLTPHIQHSLITVAKTTH